MCAATPGGHEVQYSPSTGTAARSCAPGPAALRAPHGSVPTTPRGSPIDQLARVTPSSHPTSRNAGRQAAADYTLGGYANGMRDLSPARLDTGDPGGHSFGGGVAMQFAYQFPERTERLILVGSGGLGPEVSPVIRALTTPGIEYLMGPLTLPGVRHVVAAAMRGLSRTGVKEFRDYGEVAAIYESSRTTRLARRSATSRGPSSTGAARSSRWPTALPHRGDAACVIWGEDDRVIPRPTPRSRATWLPAPGRDDANPATSPTRTTPRVRADRQRLRPQDPAATYSRARFARCEERPRACGSTGSRCRWPRCADPPCVTQDGDRRRTWRVFLNLLTLPRHAKSDFSGQREKSNAATQASPPPA